MRLLHMHQVATVAGSKGSNTKDKAIDYVFRTLFIPVYYYLIAVFIGATLWKTCLWEGGLLTGYGVNPRRGVGWKVAEVERAVVCSWAKCCD